jgi:hypothetical protein
MKTFNQILNEIKKPAEKAGHYIDPKTGDVVLNVLVGDKSHVLNRKKKTLDENFAIPTGMKLKKKPSKSTDKKASFTDKWKENHAPQKISKEDPKHDRTPINDVNYHKNIYGETGDDMLATHKGHDMDQAESISVHLHKTCGPHPDDHKAISHYTDGKTDSEVEEKRPALGTVPASSSKAMAVKAIENTKKGLPTDTGLGHQDKAAHNALENSYKPIGKTREGGVHHLYSGVHPSFGEAIKAADPKKGGSGVIKTSETHMSFTHDVDVAAGFSTQHRSEVSHMIHMATKPSDHAVHVSRVEGNPYASEAETVVKGNLRYHGTTHHIHNPDSESAHKIDVHHCSIAK